ncbi:MAG: ATP-binding protein, partial [Blastocatellia bacterium]
MSGTETYSFGEWLKQRRERLRLTQRELAAITHCSPAMIKKIEADERHPSPELAELLAGALKVPQPDHELFIQVARGERPVDALWRMQAEATTSVLPFHAPVPLPVAATPFVGRSGELAQIGERLAQPNCRLLTLVGPGGIGKTRLALAAAQTQQTAFVDGAAFASLAALTDAALIADVIARSLRLTLSGPAAEQVLSYLRRRSMLLILDNCEQLDGDLTWLSELLAHAPRVKLLATSRERLHLAEEWIYTTPELAEAAALFVETAQRLKQDFNSEAEQSAITRICQLVENLPLAVELAASWTPLMSCAQIAEHIQRDLNILAVDVRNVPDRHRSVQ